MTSDDVKRGQLVVITGHRCGDSSCDAQFTGRPFKVAQVSHPFAVLEDCADGERLPIDLRQWQLGKVSRAYVNALVDADDCEDEQPRQQDGHKRCVRCGERLVQKHTVKLGWCWWCGQCEKIMEVAA